MAKGLILWSQDEESWVINPCLNCKNSYTGCDHIYCYEIDQIVNKDDFCSLWIRKANEM